MDEPRNEVLEVLIEIRDILNRIYVCFESDYLEIQKRKEQEKSLAAILTDVRRRIFLLLVDDNKHLSQAEIAKETGVSRQAVNLFVSLLIKNGFIDEIEEGDKTIYRDKNNLIKFVQEQEKAGK